MSDVALVIAAVWNLMFREIQDSTTSEYLANRAFQDCAATLGIPHAISLAAITSLVSLDFKMFIYALGGLQNDPQVPLEVLELWSPVLAPRLIVNEIARYVGPNGGLHPAMYRTEMPLMRTAAQFSTLVTCWAHLSARQFPSDTPLTPTQAATAQMPLFFWMLCGNMLPSARP
jgi:hypothetical protein